MKIIQAGNVYKSYGKAEGRFEALKGVSLAVEEGESIALVGKSGSGKSTLMHILAALDSPDQGNVVVNEQDISKMRLKQLDKLRNEQFGFVFQQFFLTPRMSVLENVVMPLKIRGVGKRERDKRGMVILEQLGIADKARNAATALSGGQKQRVVIARALVGNPKIIFADEPTGNLDTLTGSQVQELLFSLNRERGITLVVVTHDHDLAARCQRSVTLSDGQFVA